MLPGWSQWLTLGAKLTPGGEFEPHTPSSHVDDLCFACRIKRECGIWVVAIGFEPMGASMSHLGAVEMTALLDLA